MSGTTVASATPSDRVIRSGAILALPAAVIPDVLARAAVPKDEARAGLVRSLGLRAPKRAHRTRQQRYWVRQ
jgi:hypothetical protein